MYSSTRLGPYQVESKLGEGGMGEVFRAVDTRLGRGVAIKVVDQLSASRNPGRSASVPINSLATTIWAISSIDAVHSLERLSAGDFDAALGSYDRALGVLRNKGLSAVNLRRRSRA
jgi:serine/threonine protein kinase